MLETHVNLVPPMVLAFEKEDERPSSNCCRWLTSKKRNKRTSVSSISLVSKSSSQFVNGANKMEKSYFELIQSMNNSPTAMKQPAIETYGGVEMTSPDQPQKQGEDREVEMMEQRQGQREEDHQFDHQKSLRYLQQQDREDSDHYKLMIQESLSRFVLNNISKEDLLKLETVARDLSLRPQPSKVSILSPSHVSRNLDFESDPLSPRITESRALIQKSNSNIPTVML